MTCTTKSTMSLSPKAFDDICLRLKKNDSSLTMLNLNNQGIGNTGAVRLASALKHNTHLVVLFLDNNDISSTAFEKGGLAESIAQHTTLQLVYLSYNYMGDTGAKALARAFQMKNSSSSSSSSSSKIQVLKLSNNGIGASGAAALADALPDHLHSLTLDGNNIQTKGAVALAENLGDNAILKKLDLRYNNIRNNSQVIQSFCKMLKDDNRILSEVLLEEEDWSLEDDDSTARKEFQLYLRLNKAGRHSFGDTSVPLGLWARVLGNVSDSRRATTLTSNGYRPNKKNKCATKGDPNLILAVLTSRPDLLANVNPNALLD